MPKHDIMVIGASAGGVEAIPAMLRQVKPDIRASILVVLHLSPDGPSFFPAIIQRGSGLPASHPEDGEPLRQGHVYVAPPDLHMVVEKHCVRCVRGPRENRHRPAVDPLFRSAAVSFGARVVGTILTGALDDGTEGLQAVAKCGGKTIVQNPEEAAVPGMPLSALRSVEVNHVLPLARIGPMLNQLAKTEAQLKKNKECADFARQMAQFEKILTAEDMSKVWGAPTAFICPECNGPLWDTGRDKVPHFRCLSGHAFSTENLLAGESDAVERALWIAVKTLEERASLLMRLSGRAGELDQHSSRDRFNEDAQDHLAHAELLRDILKRVMPGRRTPLAKEKKRK